MTLTQARMKETAANPHIPFHSQHFMCLFIIVLYLISKSAHCTLSKEAELECYPHLDKLDVNTTGSM